MSYAASAISYATPKFYVSDPSSSQHLVHRANFISRVKETVRKAARSRGDSAKIHVSVAAQIAEEANSYAKFFGLRWRLKPPKFSAAFIAKIRAQAAIERNQKAAATKLANDKRRRELAEIVLRWQSGEAIHIPYNYPDILLRVEDDQVRTSKDAVFPVEHGKRAFEFIRECRANGRVYERNGHLIRLGHFTIDRIEANGDVRAGCHIVRWSEIARCARTLGLNVEPRE